VNPSRPSPPTCRPQHRPVMALGVASRRIEPYRGAARSSEARGPTDPRSIHCYKRRRLDPVVDKPIEMEVAGPVSADGPSRQARGFHHPLPPQ
jgi:hypothetical protein